VSPVKYEQGFYITEDDILHSHCCENLKSYVINFPFYLLFLVCLALAFAILLLLFVVLCFISHSLFISALEIKNQIDLLLLLYFISKLFYWKASIF
jgi:hypothetical protein